MMKVSAITLNDLIGGFATLLSLGGFVWGFVQWRINKNTDDIEELGNRLNAKLPELATREDSKFIWQELKKKADKDDLKTISDNNETMTAKVEKLLVIESKIESLVDKFNEIMSSIDRLDETSASNTKKLRDELKDEVEVLREDLRELRRSMA